MIKLCLNQIKLWVNRVKTGQTTSKERILKRKKTSIQTWKILKTIHFKTDIFVTEYIFVCKYIFSYSEYKFCIQIYIKLITF